MTTILEIKDINIIKADQTVLIGGCFDILHPGHIEFLTKAKELGKKLIVLLESDKNIRKMKGKNRPLNNQITRAQNLSELNIIDFVILLAEPTNSQYYYNLVKLIRPDIIAVTRGDPLLKVKKDQANLVSGKVVEVMHRNEDFSTSKLLTKIKKI